jgi:hypothetical protein
MVTYVRLAAIGRTISAPAKPRCQFQRLAREATRALFLVLS